MSNERFHALTVNEERP